ncbi:MAG: 50S ribosomal protein L10 [Patescibacteria group bacterium]|jgi:large subunit ribosomal protein L10
MLLTKEKKSELLSDLKNKLDKKMILFIGYQGMSNELISGLRDTLAEKDLSLKVTKNTLLRIVLKEKNIEIPQEILDQQLAIIISDDEIIPAKSVHEFMKINEMPQVLGGVIDGNFIDQAYVKKLAMLPTREELLAKVVGSISSPTYSFVNVLNANIRGLINVLSQIK